MDYDQYAGDYAWARWAFPWILRPLADQARRLPARATVVEIGCGTGNYLIALARSVPGPIYKGFDRSASMLSVARSRAPELELLEGDADVRFPFASHQCHLAFTVDVVHHLHAVPVFFGEAARILRPGGRLLVVTDSPANIRERSLSRFFPEILEIELERYPSLEDLHQSASRAGLQLVGSSAAEGEIDLDDAFVTKIEAKCSSAMRLIAPEAHRAGVERVRRAKEQGETWLSCYTVLSFRAPSPAKPD